MKEIYLNYLTEKKDAKKLAYDVLEERTNISRAKLQRIFTGQVDVTVSDLETIVEKGFDESTDELYARMGKQEFLDAKEFDYKGAKELISDFNAEKAQIPKSTKTSLVSLSKLAKMRKQLFLLLWKRSAISTAKTLIILQASSRTMNHIFETFLSKQQMQTLLLLPHKKRAEDAEKDRESSDKRRHQVFWCMILLVFALLGIIIASFVLNIPAVGWGNQ